MTLGELGVSELKQEARAMADETSLKLVECLKLSERERRVYEAMVASKEDAEWTVPDLGRVIFGDDQPCVGARRRSIINTMRWVIAKTQASNPRVRRVTDLGPGRLAAYKLERAK